MLCPMYYILITYVSSAASLLPSVAFRRIDSAVHVHSGGNDRFCARLKTDISASNSGLRGRTRSCLTFLEKGRRDESKMVRHDLR
jgi:hypothetical protein